MKTLYTYDETTKEYLGEEVQYIDPLETKKAGKKIYVKITNGTNKKPRLDKPFKTNVFTNGGWKLLDDYRSAEMFYIKTAKPVDFKLGEAPTKEMTDKDPTLFTKPLWDYDALEWKEEATQEEVIADLKSRLS